MPSDCSWPTDYMIVVRQAIHRHFRQRGIPERRWDGLTARWIKRRGWKAPAGETP